MWQIPIYDRTAANVTEGADKCYLNAETLNRIESNTAYMASLLGAKVATRHWEATDFLTRSEMERILQNIQAVRDAYFVLPGTSDLPEGAARSLYLIKASFGTDRHTFATAPKGVCNISASFPAVQERLRRVIIENLDFEHLIKTYDRENALFYCDPPYFETEKYYRARFQESDHKRLADVLHSIKGRFLLSYNDCPQVRELYADCIIEPVSRRNTLSAQSVDGYKEVLVRNYEL